MIEGECDYESWILLYNDADIDASRIVWARSLSAEKDSNLLDYYADRTKWRVEVKNGTFTLRSLNGF
jgi:hypothetical protein